MAKDILHVVPHNEGWAVKREGNERHSTTHSTQKEAIDSARSLAHDGDDIVIHRADGTIREHVTYTDPGERVASRNGTVTPSDTRSVGTRVSWAAVFAGAVVALTTYLTLMLLATAIGVSVSPHVSGQEFVVIGAIVATFTLIVSVFLGGYVASQTTAGESRKEAVIYGVLVWGALFGLLFLSGNALATGLGSVWEPISRVNSGPGLTETQIQELNLSEEQKARYDEIARQTGATPTVIAWWAVGSVLLSLIASVLGSLAGAGPEFRFLRFPARTQPTVTATA